jgi:drug/metabolite transporter (DMT)-like permease
VGWLILSSLVASFAIPLNGFLFDGADPLALSAVFCSASTVVFAPFFRRNGLAAGEVAKLLAIGALQFGVMYCAYQASFLFLRSHEVALLLAPTPLYIAFADGFFLKKTSKALVVFSIAATIIAIPSLDFSQKFCFEWRGVALTQLCNLSFAFGQIMLRRFLTMRRGVTVLQVSSALYAGAAAICLAAAIFFGDCANCLGFTPGASLRAAIFGSIACGGCHLLFNIGAISTTTPVLAAMSNLQIPLAIVISCTIFGEKVDGARFVGSACLVSVALLPYAVKRLWCRSGE